MLRASLCSPSVTSLNRIAPACTIPASDGMPLGNLGTFGPESGSTVTCCPSARRADNNIDFSTWTPERRIRFTHTSNPCAYSPETGERMAMRSQLQRPVKNCIVEAGSDRMML